METAPSSAAERRAKAEGNSGCSEAEVLWCETEESSPQSEGAPAIRSIATGRGHEVDERRRTVRCHAVCAVGNTSEPLHPLMESPRDLYQRRSWVGRPWQHESTPTSVKHGGRLRKERDGGHAAEIGRKEEMPVPDPEAAAAVWEHRLLETEAEALRYRMAASRLKLNGSQVTALQEHVAAALNEELKSLEALEAEAVRQQQQEEQASKYGCAASASAPPLAQ